MQPIKYPEPAMPKSQVPTAVAVGPNDDAPKPSAARKAKARRETRADKSKTAPGPDGRRAVLVWSVTLAPTKRNPVVDWLVAAPFRPSVGGTLETGGAPVEARAITASSAEGVPLPNKWRGQSTNYRVRPDTAPIKVRAKSAVGDGQAKERAAASGREAQKHQAPYVAEPAKPEAKRAPRERQRENRAAKAASEQLAIVPASPAPSKPATPPAWVQRAAATLVGTRSPEEIAGMAVDMVVALAATPQGQRAMEIAERAFPGAKLALAAAPASTFAALASGAAHVARQRYTVHAFYDTCPTWADGAHLMQGGRRGPPPSWWASGRPAAAAPGSRNQPGPATFCDHSPSTCRCISNDVSSKTLMFGMSPDVTPAQVVAWTRRWGRVLCIAPNAAFADYSTKLEAATRSYGFSGDTVPVVLPSGRWFGPQPYIKVPNWFWQSATVLSWTKTPVGAAFHLVEFGIDERGGSFLPASVSAFLGGPTYELEAATDYWCHEGAPRARDRVVREASAALAGRPLTQEAWAVAERTAARVVRERQGELPAHEEIRAGAEIAWAVTAGARRDWQLMGVLGEFFNPTPDSFRHGAGFAARLNSQNLTFLVAALALWRQRRRGPAAAVLAILAWRLRWPTATAEAVSPKAAIAALTFAATAWVAVWQAKRNGRGWEEAAGTYSAVLATPLFSNSLAFLVALAYNHAVPGHDAAFPTGLSPQDYLRRHYVALTTVAAPVVEETLKRGWPGYVHAVVAWELFTYVGAAAPGCRFQAAVNRVPTSLAHFAWARLPLPMGIAMHSLYNLAALRSELSSWVPAMVRASSWYSAAAAWAAGEGPAELPGLCPAECGDPLPDNGPALTLVDKGPMVPCKPRVMVALVGPGTTLAPPVVYASCVHSELNAMRRRLGAPQLWFDPEVTEEWRDLHRALRSDLAEWYYEPLMREAGPRIEPIPFDRWLAHYPGTQRRLIAVSRELARAGGTLSKRAWRLDAFVKVETTPKLLEDVADKQPKARLIQGRSPLVTSRVGPTFASLGKVLGKIFDPAAGGPVVYLGGSTAEMVGAWYGECLAAGLLPWPLDADEWDASQGPGPIRSWAMDVYALRPNREVRSLLAQRLGGFSKPTPGRTKNGISYLLAYEVRSGDGDTSCGNSANHAKAWIRELADPASPIRGARVAINGDNALLMAPHGATRPVLDAVVARMRGLGYRFSFEAPGGQDHLGQVCSGRLWATADSGWVYGPKIGRILSKSFWILYPPNSGDRRLGWLKSTAMSLRDSTAHIPVLRVVVSSILHTLRDVKAVELQTRHEEWRLLASRPHEAGWATFAQAAAIYGTTVEAIHDLEAWVVKQPLLGAAWRHPTLDLIVRVDLGDGDAVL